MVYKPLSREETNRLILEAQSGDNASRHKIFLANAGLIYDIAFRFALGREEEFSDFTQEGAIGLLSAIEHYKISSVKFSTYAYRCITQTIYRGAHRMRRALHIPQELSALESVAASVFFGKEECGGRLGGADKKEVETLLRQAVRNRPILLKSVRRYVKHCYNKGDRFVVKSLDDKVNGKNGDSNVVRRAIDFVKSRDAQDIEFDVKNLLIEILTELNPRERFVLSCRFGVPYDGDSSVQPNKSYGQVGKYLGVSRGGARQIQKRALAKLRGVLEERGLSYGDLICE